MLGSLRDTRVLPNHELYIGATGTAKTTRAEQQIHKIIGEGYGCAVFSPTRELIDSLLVRFSDETLAKTHLIEPTNPFFAVGINILEVHNPGLAEGDAIAFTSTFLLDTIRATFGEEALQVRSGSILKEFLGLLLSAGKHPAETYLAWDPGEDGLIYRQLLYPRSRDTNPFYEAYIARNIDALPRSSERHAMLEASLNKMKVLFDFPALTMTLLHPDPPLNFRQIIDNDEILLVDLSSAYLGSDGVKILGGFLLSSLFMTAIRLGNLSSRDGKYWPCFCDEFHEYTTSRILLGLAVARKLGLFFSLICQDRNMINRVIPEAWNSIINNAACKYVFRCSDEETRDSLINELFGYNHSLASSIGSWEAQRQVHAANIGALQRGEYFFQDGTLFKQSGSVDGQMQMRFLEAHLERTSGNGSKVLLPPLQDPSKSVEEESMRIRHLLLARDAQSVPRQEVYKRITDIYKQASEQVQSLRNRKDGASSPPPTQEQPPLPRS